jgi:hypothetical protein
MPFVQSVSPNVEIEGFKFCDFDLLKPPKGGAWTLGGSRTSKKPVIEKQAVKNPFVPGSELVFSLLRSLSLAAKDVSVIKADLSLIAATNRIPNRADYILDAFKLRGIVCRYTKNQAKDPISWVRELLLRAAVDISGRPGSP